MLTVWHQSLIEKVKSYGGFVNAHLHLDRADTYKNPKISEKTIKEKQRLIYKEWRRSVFVIQQIAEKYLKWFVENNYRQAWTTADNEIAAKALDCARKKIGFDLKIAAYSPTGINDEMLNRVKNSDYICGLPEVEAHFVKACEKLIDIAIDSDKELHLHIDQGNTPYSYQLETLCKIKPRNTWVIHAIAPSCYENKRFFKLVDEMLENDIGLICCPSAAIGMYQDRRIKAPLHNSIARLREMYEAGIKIRLGSDNICDIFSPSASPSLLTEIIIASNATRWYDVDAWALMASGRRHRRIQVSRDMA